MHHPCKTFIWTLKFSSKYWFADNPFMWISSQNFVFDSPLTSVWRWNGISCIRYPHGTKWICHKKFIVVFWFFRPDKPISICTGFADTQDVQIHLVIYWELSKFVPRFLIACTKWRICSTPSLQIELVHRTIVQYFQNISNLDGFKVGKWMPLLNRILVWKRNLGVFCMDICIQGGHSCFKGKKEFVRAKQSVDKVLMTGEAKMLIDETNAIWHADRNHNTFVFELSHSLNNWKIGW